MPDTPKPLSTQAATVLAYDFGTRHIGMAVGQTLTHSARPLAVLAAKDGQPDWAEVLKHITEWRPGLLVVGLPLNIDGTESPFCQRARKFARRLQGRSGCKVIMYDERLSTREAKSETKIAQSSRNYRESPVDAMAACLILQSWLQEPDFALSP